MPRTTVFLNGAFIDDPALARVSAFDAGFQHALGLFETMIGGVKPAAADQPDAQAEIWVHRLDEHVARLIHSAGELGLAEYLNAAALEQAVLATVARSGLERARIRLTITAGDLNLLSQSLARAALNEAAATRERSRHDPTILIVAQPATTYPRAMYEQGVRIALADAKANPLNPLEGHKTVSYWWRLRELQQASMKGCAEALVLSVTNHVVSGCVSNIFVVRKGRLMTPIARGEEGLFSHSTGEANSGGGGGVGGVGDGGGWSKTDVDDPAMQAAMMAQPTGPSKTAAVLPSPVLPGITRGWVMEKADLWGWSMQREMLSVADVLDADEVFLTNSSWGVLPVMAIEKSAIRPDAAGKPGGPGPMSRRLIQAWREETQA